jgi:hypothetical protein
MEDYINILKNVRQPQSIVNGRRHNYFSKWNTTSKCKQMEDEVIYFEKLKFFSNSQSFFRVGSAL